jgi:ATP-dependent DNA helicase RecG
VLTATPIPRTLSLTLYGDLDVSILDELPPGRTPIETRMTSEPHLQGVWNGLRREVEAGHQAYIVYPVIEESKLELKAAIDEYERLSKEVFPKLKLGLLHGRLSSEEKEDVMQRFRKNEVQILVATTVVEVGVDVPNASVMVVEQAERFGLAQLHQLRGRVGRGAAQSYCILVTDKMNDTARQRIRTLVESTDGFYISEMDLKLRGPGEFFGTRQSGDLGFHIANPLRDRELLELARRDWHHPVQTRRRIIAVSFYVGEFLGEDAQVRNKLCIRDRSVRLLTVLVKGSIVDSKGRARERGGGHQQQRQRGALRQPL